MRNPKYDTNDAETDSPTENRIVVAKGKVVGEG